MPTNYKVLGQAALTTAVANVYTVPANTQTVISTVVVTNRTSSNVNYRLAVQPAGAALANQHYIAFDASVPGNDTIALTLGITLDAADVLYCYASTASVAFGAFGTELS